MATGTQNLTSDKARVLSTQPGTSKIWRGDNTWSSLLLAEQMSLDLKSTSASTWTALHLYTSVDNGATIYINGSERNADGENNMLTIRNNIGDLRLDDSTVNTGNLTVGQSTINTSYKFYVNGTSYFNGNTTHNGIDYFANGTTYYINNSGTASLNSATIAGTLYLTRTTDAEGTADNKPALIIGTLSGAHLEFDGNEIMAKGSATTTSTLYLNNNGGQTYFGGNISCASILTVRAENSTTEGGQICLTADPNHSAYSANLDVCNNYFRIHSNGKERISIQLTDGGNHNLNGNVYATGEFVSKTANGLRIKNIMLRNDSSDVYFLVATNSNTPGDNWNSLRPFSFNIGTGRVTMSNGANIGYTNTGYSLSVNTMIANDHVYSRNALYTNGNLNIFYNNTWYPVIRNYGNANITMNACSGTLHLGYENTAALWFGSSGSQKASLDANHLYICSRNPVGDPHSGAAIEIRETSFGGTYDGNEVYCPRIGFHWSGRVAAWLGLLADGWFKLGRENNAYYGIRTGSHEIYSGTTRILAIQSDHWIHGNGGQIYFGGNFHLDSKGGYHIYLNYHNGGQNIYFGNAGHAIHNNGANYTGTAANSDTVDGYHASSLWRSDGGTWNAGANISCVGNNTEWSFDMSGAGSMWHVWSDTKGSCLICYRDTGTVNIPLGLTVAGAMNFNCDVNVNSGRVISLGADGNNDQGDIIWWHNNGRESARLWTAQGFTQAAGPYWRCYNTSGTLLISGNITVSSGSSRYIKHNIHSLSENEAIKVLQLNPVFFEYNTGCGPSGVRTGMIAEEVLPIMPQVTYDFPVYEDSTNVSTPTRVVKAINYELVLPYVIKLVQMQQKEIENLKQTINQLQNNL